MEISAEIATKQIRTVCKVHVTHIQYKKAYSTRSDNLSRVFRGCNQLEMHCTNNRRGGIFLEGLPPAVQTFSALNFNSEIVQKAKYQISLLKEKSHS